MANTRRDYRGEVLGFVQRFVTDNGYPPTMDEIRESVGLCSKSHVGYYLDVLEEEGLVKRKPRTPRGLCLVGSSEEIAECQ